MGAQLIKGWDANAGVPLWIKLVVPATVCALVALAGLIPAVRVARLTAVQVIAAGQSPQTAHGSRFGCAVGRLPLPRPVALGIASAFSRPGASLGTAAVVAAGLAAAVLAVGLNAQMFGLVVGATTPRDGAVLAGQALVRRLTLLVFVVATLGVLSAVIMLARQRVHDLGIYKAIGMTPRQIVVTIVSWVIAPAILATVIALPVSIVIEHAVANAIVDGQTAQLSQVAPGGGGFGSLSARGGRVGRAASGPRVVYRSTNSGRVRARAIDLGSGASGVELPPAYDPGTVILLALAGLAVAVAGALGPASWAALVRTTTALRAE